MLHLLAALCIACVLIAAIAAIRRQSATVGAIVMAGAVIRLVAGVALFWVSSQHLPVARSFQLEGGFWTPMPDAVNYYAFARDAIEYGRLSLPTAGPAPFFTGILAAWMWLVGTTPAAGFSLNLFIYIASALLLTRLFGPVGRWRDDCPLIVVIATMSFSPLLVLVSTQPLKDDLFLGLTLVMGAAMKAILHAFERRAKWWRFAAALAVLAAAAYGIAGIRGYYLVIVSAAAASAFVVQMLSRTQVRRSLVFVACGLTVAAIWTAYWAGAGSRFRPSPVERRLIAEVLRRDSNSGASAILTTTGILLDRARGSFARTGGATNVVTRPGTAGALPPTSTDASRATPSPDAIGRAAFMGRSPRTFMAPTPPRVRFAAIGVGLALIVVPISILKAASVVTFAGGGGLLPLADLDTVVLDLSLIFLAMLLVRRRRQICSRSFVTFGVATALITAPLLGYVVTNFGTLFRLRLMVAAPLWILALALSPRSRTDPPSSP